MSARSRILMAASIMACIIGSTGAAAAAAPRAITELTGELDLGAGVRRVHDVMTRGFEAQLGIGFQSCRPSSCFRFGFVGNGFYGSSVEGLRTYALSLGVGPEAGIGRFSVGGGLRATRTSIERATGGDPMAGGGVGVFARFAFDVYPIAERSAVYVYLVPSADFLTGKKYGEGPGQTRANNASVLSCFLGVGARI